MAPPRGKSGLSKGSSKGSSKGPSKGGSKPRSGAPSSGGIRKKPTGKPGVKPKIIQQKTKSSLHTKKKPRVYTEKELGIPELNGIRPAGVVKPPNAKKGKHFVDDGDGMAAILAMVMADKSQDIESKMQRSRALEQVREARKAEAEMRERDKKDKFEERKGKIKETEKKKRRGAETIGEAVKRDGKDPEGNALRSKKTAKRVSFG